MTLELLFTLVEHFLYWLQESLKCKPTRASNDPILSKKIRKGSFRRNDLGGLVGEDRNEDHDDGIVGTGIMSVYSSERHIFDSKVYF